MATFASDSTAATVAAPSGQRRCSTSVSFDAAGRRRRLSSVARCNVGPKQLRISANLAGLWEAARGASPAAVLATAAAAAVIYKVTSGLLAPARPPPPRQRQEPETAAPPARAPVEVGELSEEELRQYDGSDPEKPLLMAINGQIYDVSQSRMFYGPGGPYTLFAGKDASRALAKMSFEPQDLTGDISGLGPFELSALQDWECKFMNKYVKVGIIKQTVHVEEGIGSTSPETQEQVAADMELKEDNAPRTDLSFEEKNENRNAD